MDEERTDDLDTSTQDSGDTEHLGSETEGAEDKTSTEGTPEGEHVEGGEDKTGGDESWKQRYFDLQGQMTKVSQELSEVKKGQEQRLQSEDRKKFEEESKKKLDAGTYIERYKDNPTQGLNEWANAREQSTMKSVYMRSVYSMIGPATSQSQLTLWRTMKILQELAPEIVEKHLEKEKAIKKVLNDVPALYNYPNYLDQAEKMVLSKVSGKDLKQLEQKLEKDIKKSIEQQTGKSIPATKAPLKDKSTKEGRYKDYIMKHSKRRTVL